MAAFQVQHFLGQQQLAGKVVPERDPVNNYTKLKRKSLCFGVIFWAHSQKIVGVIECCKECPFLQVEEGAGAEEGEEEQAEEDEIVEGEGDRADRAERLG